MKNRHIVFFVFVFAIISCKEKQNTDPIEPGFDYYPIDQGLSLIYDVDSIVYDDNADTIIHYRYQIREIFTDTFTDNTGNTAYVIERSRRDTGTQEWSIVNAAFATRTLLRAERTNGDQTFVKLIFPTQDGTFWNGNMRNSLEEQEYIYRSVNQPGTIGTFNFDSTLTVVQEEDSNFVEIRRASERYAKHVGMIFKQCDSLNFVYTFNNQGEIIDTKIKGLEYRLTLNAYNR